MSHAARSCSPLIRAAGLFIAPLFFIIPITAAAQPQPKSIQPGTGSFSGTLLDPTGRTLSGVPVTLANPATGQKHESRSDDAGRFSLAGLAAGEYQILISKPGFSDLAGRVMLGSGQQLQREVVPQIASLTHMYKVSSNADGAGVQAAESNANGLRTKVVRTTLPDDPCAKSTAGGCLTPPMRMVEAWPLYPRGRADAGVSGTVEVSARLGTDGFLKEFRANEGADPEFAAAAIEALRLWEYSPLRLNGVPQEGRMTVTFRFVTGKN